MLFQGKTVYLFTHSQPTGNIENLLWFAQNFCVLLFKKIVDDSGLTHCGFGVVIHTSLEHSTSSLIAAFNVPSITLNFLPTLPSRYIGPTLTVSITWRNRTE